MINLQWLLNHRIVRRLVSILAYAFYSLTASAQLLQPVYSAPSPQAAALGEYGEVPVSHFTGTPEVSVPLFEIEAGDQFGLRCEEPCFQHQR